MSSSTPSSLSPELRRLRQDLVDRQSTLDRKYRQRLADFSVLSAQVIEVLKGDITAEERRTQLSKLRESYKHIQRIQRTRLFYNNAQARLHEYIHICNCRDGEQVGAQMEAVEKELREVGELMQVLVRRVEGSNEQ